MTKQADVVVIGGGITGTAILHELAKYNLRAILVEREPELAAWYDEGEQCDSSCRI
jgi:glycerol-3-phosphate dehydrogenase